MEHSPEHALRIAELPPRTRTRAEKLAAFIREEFRALQIPLGGTAEDAEALKKLAMDPSIPEERLEALEEATETLAGILQGKDVLFEDPDSISLDAFSDWLTAEDLNAKLEKPLASFIDAHLKACADGTMGYTVDPSTIRFAFPEGRADALRAGLESGALNGVVLVAYPTRRQLEAIAARTERPLDELLELPVHAFLLQHLHARGGAVNFMSLAWNTDMRVPPPGVSLSGLFHAESAKRGIAPPDWFEKKSNGRPDYENPTVAYRDIHAAVYDSLPAPLTLADMVDAPPQLLVTNVRQEIPSARMQLTGGTASMVAMGDFFSFARCMFEGIDPLPGAAFIALAGVAKDLKNLATYPTPWDIEDKSRQWEHVGGLTMIGSPRAGSSRKGLVLLEGHPTLEAEEGRVRSCLA